VSVSVHKLHCVNRVFVDHSIRYQWCRDLDLVFYFVVLNLRSCSCSIR